MLPSDATRRSFGRSKELDNRESSIERRVKRYARDLGYWVRKFKSPGKRDAPDDIFKHPNSSVVFFIEFKAFGKEPTSSQLEEHAVMRAAGLTVYVVDNFEDGVAIIDRYCL